jgi:ParB family chromosome partitioning protein
MNKKSLFEKIQEDFKPIRFTIEDTPNKTKPAENKGQEISLIPAERIQPDPNQPRKLFDQPKLEELADSIKSKGVIQPIAVRPNPNRQGTYLIVAGERRFRAARLADLSEIPCVIKDITGQEALILQMIENLHRDDLKPIEEATGIKRLTEIGFNQTDISKLIGKSQPYVSQLLKILTLPEAILRESEQNRISKEHLLQLTRTESPEKMWQEIKCGGTAKEIREKAARNTPSRGRPKNFTRTIKPEGTNYKITIHMRKAHATVEEVIEALKEAATLLARETNEKPGIPAD